MTENRNRDPLDLVDAVHAVRKTAADLLEHYFVQVLREVGKPIDGDTRLEIRAIAGDLCDAIDGVRAGAMIERDRLEDLVENYAGEARGRIVVLEERLDLVLEQLAELAARKASFEVEGVAEAVAAEGSLGGGYLVRLNQRGPAHEVDVGTVLRDLGLHDRRIRLTVEDLGPARQSVTLVRPWSVPWRCLGGCGTGGQAQAGQVVPERCPACRASVAILTPDGSPYSGDALPKPGDVVPHLDRNGEP